MNIASIFKDFTGHNNTVMMDNTNINFIFKGEILREYFLDGARLDQLTVLTEVTKD